MRRARLWVLLAVGLVVASWAAWGRWGASEAVQTRLDGVRERGNAVLVGEESPGPPQVSWSRTFTPSREQLAKMAKCPIESGKYGGSATLHVTVWNIDGAHTSVSDVQLGCGAGAVHFFLTAVDTAFHYTIEYNPGDFGDGVDFDIPIPAEGEMATYSWTWTWNFSGAYLEVTSASYPIAEKGVTHSKEIVVTESWEVPAGTTITMSVIGDCGVSVTRSKVVEVVAMSMGLSFNSEDIDYWDDKGYVLRFTGVSFCGENINASGYTARDIGLPTHDNVWGEGLEGGEFRFWAGPGSAIGGTVSWSQSTVAPYSYDFSPYQVLWSDGTPVDTSVMIYCTGMRQVIGGIVYDLPWHGSIAEWKSKRWVQKYGCHSWDTQIPDMLPTVVVYFDMESAEADGIEIRGPRPEWEVAGAGFGLTFVGGTPVPGPFDGKYKAEGLWNDSPLYGNGYGALYLYDKLAGTWAVGPGPGVPPYYLQEGGGPGGSYLVNTASYADDIIDEMTGQRRFSGLSGYGIGPAVSETTGEAIAVNSDCAGRSFAHDARFILDTWPLTATNRTVSPYMTDIVSLTVDAPKGIYADAHTAENWVGANCTTPDALGDFTIGAGGGSLTLTLASNYIARQLEAKGTGHPGSCPVPTCYLFRRHDALFGAYNTEANHEAVWDWRGRYLYHSVKLPAVPADVTYTIRYYDDLLGVGDNHKTDNSRQTEYTYAPGSVYTLTRTIPVTYKYPDDWPDVSLRGCSPILIDLYDEQNGHPVALAVDVTVHFPDAGAANIGEPLLTLDVGDQQEVGTVAPFYREAPTYNGLEIKTEESWRYAQGLVSAIINGLCDRVLFVPDNAKSAMIERTLDTLAVSYGAQTGQDFTTCYALGAWPFTGTGDAFTLTHSQPAEDAHMVDADGARLRVIGVYDLCSLGQVQGGAYFSTVAVRCGEISCVPGLPYSFYGSKVVGGRGHGMVVKAAKPNDFPRARSATTGKLYRRHYGDEATSWGLIETLAASGEHAHWASAAHEISDTDAARTLWEYRVNTSDLGRFATREWALAETWLTPHSRPCLWVEPVTGICHLVYVNGADVRYCQSDPWTKQAGFRGWRYGGIDPVAETPQTIAVFTGGYTDPAVVVMGTREIIISARSTTSPYPVTLKRSRDQGATWEGITVGTFVADLTQLALWQHRGVLHGAGISGTNAVYRRSDDGGVTAKSLDGTATVTATVCAAEDEQPALVRDPTGVLYAAVNTGAALTVMVSADGGNTWAEAGTI